MVQGANTQSKKQSRLIFGDCIDVMGRLPDQCVDLVVTDPPYLVNYTDRKGRRIIGDNCKNWVRPAFREIARVLKEDAFMVCFYGWHKIHYFMDAWLQAGLRPVGHFACVKDYVSKRGYTAMSHENAYLLAKGKPRICSSSLRDVLFMPYSGNKLHSTQKPVELLSTFIKAYSRLGDVVLDPFSGSGSTAIAAKTIGRECIAIEKDPQYFALAKERILSI